MESRFKPERVKKAVLDVESEVESMIESGADEGDLRRHMSDYVLMGKIGCSARVLERMYAGESPYEECAEYIQDYVKFREGVCMKYMKSTPWIFLSKQKHFGGLADIQRSETKSSQKIEITLNGADGKTLLK